MESDDASVAVEFRHRVTRASFGTMHFFPKDPLWAVFKSARQQFACALPAEPDATNIAFFRCDLGQKIEHVPGSGIPISFIFPDERPLIFYMNRCMDIGLPPESLGEVPSGSASSRSEVDSIPAQYRVAFRNYDDPTNALFVLDIRGGNYTVEGLLKSACTKMGTELSSTMFYLPNGERLTPTQRQSEFVFGLAKKVVGVEIRGHGGRSREEAPETEDAPEESAGSASGRSDDDDIRSKYRVEFREYGSSQKELFALNAKDLTIADLLFRACKLLETKMASIRFYLPDRGRRIFPINEPALSIPFGYWWKKTILVQVGDDRKRPREEALEAEEVPEEPTGVRLKERRSFRLNFVFDCDDGKCYRDFDCPIVLGNTRVLGQVLDRAMHIFLGDLTKIWISNRFTPILKEAANQLIWSVTARFSTADMPSFPIERCFYLAMQHILMEEGPASVRDRLDSSERKETPEPSDLREENATLRKDISELMKRFDSQRSLTLDVGKSLATLREVFEQQKAKFELEDATLKAKTASLEDYVKWLEGKEKDATKKVEKEKERADKFEAEAAQLKGEDLPKSIDELNEMAKMLKISSAKVKEAISVAGRKEKDSENCVVCWEEKKTVMLLPCCHLCLCESDAKAVKKCPICRGEIEEKKHVFY